MQDERLVQATPAALDLLGRSADQLAGLTDAATLLVPEAQTLFRAALKTAQAGTLPAPLEAEALLPDHTRRWLRWHLAPITPPTTLLLTLEDRQNTVALRQHQSRSRPGPTLFACSPARWIPKPSLSVR
ncbi:MAG: PAS domain-containing protein [Anaerolineae bacterium]|nr:PAS domain-containing protein [Anaerolineae bacterium]